MQEEFLPLFPLSLVVFPGETLRLHIFEARYKQLIGECLDTRLTFGIPAVVDQQLSMVATEVEVVRVDKTYPDGELDITTRGRDKVQIHEFYKVIPNKLYPGGQISRIGEQMDQNLRLQQEVYFLIQRLHDALGYHKEIQRGYHTLRAYEVGHHVGLNLRQEVELLGLHSETERLQFIRDHIEHILPVVVETERLKARARLNGHFKNLVPPEF